MFPIRLQGGERLRGIALPAEILAGLATAAKEMRPRGMGIDDQVESRTGPRRRRTVADEVGTNRDDRVGCGIEEFSKRKKRAGGEDGKDEYNCNDGG